MVTMAALGTVGIAAGVLLGVGVTGVGVTAHPTPVVGQASAAQVQPAVNGDGGFAERRVGAGGYSGGSTRTAAATTATSAQQVGIVDITSVLGYQNAEAAGTGMLLTSNGEVLTNNHVIDGATSITVTVVRTGTSYAATVVGTDATDDVAVLQLDRAAGLPIARLSTSPAYIGEAVTAVGNAGGTGRLIAAAGTVTALDQSITAATGTGTAEHLSGLIETNAAVQPGDSGGPLYGAAGTIVGMDTAASSGAPVQAYAIPISTAEQIAGQLEHGASSTTTQRGHRAFLGVSVNDGQDGAAVLGVLAAGPAAQAGLTAGDVITAMAGRTVTSAGDLTTALARHSPGQRVTLTWSDATGARHSATVTLGAGPAH